MTSAKEMDDRERFRPSDSEIDRRYSELYGEMDDSDEVDDALDEWIEAETERRMAADTADKLPFRRGK